MENLNNFLEPFNYKETFTSLTGERVLLELTSLYYDRLSYKRGDTHETAFREGQRSVIEFILRKVAEQPIIGDENE